METVSMQEVVGKDNLIILISIVNDKVTGSYQTNKYPERYT